MQKVVFITGCSTGIGKALALEFLQRGYQVVATARNLDSLKELSEKGCAVYQLDVTDADQIDRVVNQVLTDEKRIDMLINNAGYGLMGPIVELSEKKLTDQFAVNVFAPVLLAKKIAPAMIKQKQGMIVTIGSISGLVTTPFSGAYCASKAAIHNICDAMRMELADFGIKVITVQAGAVQSQFGSNAKKTVSGRNTDSIYNKQENAIQTRAEISQENATTVEKFTKKLADKLCKNNPPAIIHLGNGAYLLPLLKKLVSTSVLDSIMRKKFDLKLNNQK